MCKRPCLTVKGTRRTSGAGEVESARTIKGAFVTQAECGAFRLNLYACKLCLAFLFQQRLFVQKRLYLAHHITGAVLGQP